VAVINNVDIDKAGLFVQQVSEDPPAGRKTSTVEGEWTLEGPAEFRGKAKYEGGEVTLHSATPTFRGGSGGSPAPMQHFLFGFSACFASTYAAAAAGLGISLAKLAVRAEADVDFGPSMGLSEGPVVREVRLSIEVAADAPAETLARIGELALKRGPVVYAMTHAMSVTPSLKTVDP
jgi:uncharacterized OsmC-like protein